MSPAKLQSGFTLIEIAIVVLIVTILLGYTVAMFPLQQELRQYREVEGAMDSIVEHLIGFAQVNGRLPCPDTSGDVNGTGTAGVIDGQEDTDDEIDNVTGAAGADGLVDNCKAFSGFLPAGTIGISDDVDANGRLVDPWGQPFRYHVSDLDQGVDGVIDLVSPNGVRDEGLANVGPNLNLVICRDSSNPSAADVACPVAGDTVVANAAVVVYSSGRDRANVDFASNIQNENRDDFHSGINDRVYTASTRNDSAGSQYDDKVRWISPHLLFARMVQAEQLP